MSAKKLGLTGKILIGMVAGAILGVILNPLNVDGSTVQFVFVDGIFRVLGEFFITSLMMLVVPLVFFSLVVGTCSLSDPASLGRLGGKAVGLYLITTAMAITLALAVANIVKPGRSGALERPNVGEFDAGEAPSFLDVLIDMVPRNPIDAMAEGNMLQIIVFALLFGIAMALAGKPGERLKVVFEDVNEIIMKLVMLLMHVAPYGVFALMARVFADLGWGEVLQGL